MNPQLQQLETRFNDMTPRERGMILGAGLVLIVMVLFTLWLEPSMKENDSLKRKLAKQQQETQVLSQQVDMLRAAIKRDPNEATQRELNNAQDEIALLDSQLNELTVDLVAAEQMLPVLQSLLAKSRDVSVLELSSVPSKPVLVGKDDDAHDVGMYRHGIVLELSGSFFDIYRLVESIEASPWRFYWQTLDYQVTDYPKAKVRIVLYTLSTSEDYIRV